MMYKEHASAVWNKVMTTSGLDPASVKSAVQLGVIEQLKNEVKDW